MTACILLFHLADASSMVANAAINEFIHLRNFLRTARDTVSLSELINSLLTIVVECCGQLDAKCADSNHDISSKALEVWSHLLLTAQVALDCYLRQNKSASAFFSNSGWNTDVSKSLPLFCLHDHPAVSGNNSTINFDLLLKSLTIFVKGRPSSHWRIVFHEWFENTTSDDIFAQKSDLQAVYSYRSLLYSTSPDITTPESILHVDSKKAVVFGSSNTTVDDIAAMLLNNRGNIVGLSWSVFQATIEVLYRALYLLRLEATSLLTSSSNPSIFSSVTLESRTSTTTWDEILTVLRNSLMPFFLESLGFPLKSTRWIVAESIGLILVFVGDLNYLCSLMRVLLLKTTNAASNECAVASSVKYASIAEQVNNCCIAAGSTVVLSVILKILLCSITSCFPRNTTGLSAFGGDEVSLTNEASRLWNELHGLLRQYLAVGISLFSDHDSWEENTKVHGSTSSRQQMVTVLIALEACSSLSHMEKYFGSLSPMKSTEMGMSPSMQDLLDKAIVLLTTDPKRCNPIVIASALDAATKMACTIDRKCNFYTYCIYDGEFNSVIILCSIFFSVASECLESTVNFWSLKNLRRLLRSICVR